MPSATKEEVISYDINVPYKITDDTRNKVKYPEYIPSWDKVWFEPLPPFEFQDPALRVKDNSLPELHKAGIKVTNITPKLGSYVSGIQLNQLNDVAKDELAWLITQRRVLAFHDQDLIDDGPATQQGFMNYYGKPNYQPVSGSIKDHPGFHIIQRDGNKDELTRFLDQKSTTTLWHQDVSYEIQPPGYVMLGFLQGPDNGGDTVFASTDTAYKLLSPIMQELVDNLQAVHTSSKMINHTRLAGGLVRKDSVDTVHPIVRVHPVTGEKCLFVNAEFISKIIGLKETEQKMLLEFLMQHIIMGHDFQARISWAPRSIVIFDNRSTCHTAVVDYVDDGENSTVRHLFRLAAMAEKPIPVSRDI
ncbi:alpha-ketoglutarate-dependent taurine dioxygenase [Jackrogersella minutella]|nr:alpha-ketoglutarate-dependent taurine dioxygenase [Jackrogersella minutella]